MLPLEFHKAGDFDGATFDPARDGKRLTRQLDMVKQILRDKKPRTLDEIREEIWLHYGVRTTETGISARLRDLRKPKFGAAEVKSGRRTGGVWEYWMP